MGTAQADMAIGRRIPIRLTGTSLPTTITVMAIVRRTAITTATVIITDAVGRRGGLSSRRHPCCANKRRDTLIVGCVSDLGAGLRLPVISYSFISMPPRSGIDGSLSAERASSKEPCNAFCDKPVGDGALRTV